MIDKIEAYLNETDYDLVANKVLGVGGSGDEQMHTSQMSKLCEALNNQYGRSLIMTPFATEAYPKDEQEQILIKFFDDNYPLMFYLGHGSLANLNKDVELANCSTPTRMKNRFLTFGIFGSCDMTEPDRGCGSIGESFVYNSRNAMVGAIVSTRTAYSNQNEAMARLTMQYMGNSPAGKPALSRTRTIGEAFLLAKNQLRTLHENTFSLMCDPALKIIVPTLAVNLEEEEEGETKLTAGRPLTLKGYISTRDGERLEDFNGNITVRIINPSVTRPTANFITGDSKKVDIVYANNVAATYRTAVTCGRFEITVSCPESQYLREGVNASIAFSAYDPTIRTAASGRKIVTVAMPEDGDENADTQAPVIERLDYMYDSKNIDVAISDDRGICTAPPTIDGMGLTIRIDGVPMDRPDEILVLQQSDGNSLTGSIDCSYLSGGTHDIVLGVTDYSGNYSERTTVFSTGKEPAQCVLKPERFASDAGMKFSVESAGGTELSGRLMVSSEGGTTMLSLPFEGNEVETDLTDAEGVRLPEGKYRAWVICDAPGYEYSPAVDFVVLPAPEDAQ